MQIMYPAANSLYTQLEQDITASQQIIPVTNGGALPLPPNFASISTWDGQEVDPEHLKWLHIKD